MMQKIHKPAKTQTSSENAKVKMGGNFWASERIRDVFRVDEHCEKKQKNTLKNVYPNFE